METQKDFKELLELFNKHKVEYVIVGAYALAFHGCPRHTGDLDLFVKPDPDNAKKIIEALKEFGFQSLTFSIDDFSSPEKVVQLGIPPIRIGLITSRTTLTWEQVASHKVKGGYGDTPVHFIDKTEFIINKKSLGRHKDLADIESITE